MKSKKPTRTCSTFCCRFWTTAAITDSQGRTVDFKQHHHHHDLATWAPAHILEGIDAEGRLSDGAKAAVQALLRSQFRPEFLNRIDDTVLFTPLSKGQVRSIVDLLLERLKARLKDKQLSLRLTRRGL